jgi:hypothetical protein
VQKSSATKNRTASSLPNKCCLTQGFYLQQQPPPPPKNTPLTNSHQYARIILPKHTQNGKIAMSTTTAKPATPQDENPKFASLKKQRTFFTPKQATKHITKPELVMNNSHTKLECIVI